MDSGPVGGQSFYVVDVGSEPVHSTTIDLLSRAVERDGDYLYTTSGTAGLSILNIGNETAPVLFGAR